MSFELAELDRRVANAVSLGTVSALDEAQALCRVAVGGLVTDWLPWLTGRAGGDRTWWTPDIGEQCIVLAPSGEMGQGIVLFGLYQDEFPAPAASKDVHLTQYKDGTTVKYDRANGVLTVDCVGDVVLKGARTLLVEFQGEITVRTPSHVTVDAPNSTFTGNVEIQGTTHTVGAVTFDAGMSGTGDVVSTGISLEGHTHSGVRGGSDTTGQPN